MQLADVLDLELAMRRVLVDSRDDFYPDVLSCKDCRSHQEEILGDLQRLLQELEQPSQYTANPLLRVDVPKPGFTLRPGSLPCFRDRLVYQAIADLLCRNFEPEPCVYSCRPLEGDTERMFAPGVQQWLLFEDRSHELCGIYQYEVRTDITAYFEHIHRDRLCDRIRDIFANVIEERTLNEAIGLIQRLHRTWYAGEPMGLPQGPDPSSFLGNMYLDEIDKMMLRHGFEGRYIRYVDDIRIYAWSLPEARRALAALIQELRKINLFVSAKKTSIRPTTEALEDMDQSRARMDAIEAAFNTRLRSEIEGIVVDLWEFFVETLESEDGFQDRHFRFCVNRFRQLKRLRLADDLHDHVVQAVLDRLESMPYAMDIFVAYLSLFPEDDVVHERVLAFLQSEFNIYEWQEAHLAELLIRSNLADDNCGRACQWARSTLYNRDGHPLPRAKAAILLGKYGDYADRAEMCRLFHDEGNEDVRRAILLATQDAAASERNRVRRRAEQLTPSLRRAASYINTLAGAVYHFFEPPQYAELLPEDDDFFYEFYWL